MTQQTDEARDAIAKQAAKLAEKADAAELKTLAEAVAQVHFGPQGADYQYANRTTYDYHSTHHPEKPVQGMGFGTGGNE